MENKTINDRFREILKDSGLSQEKFGEPLGMTRSEVKNIVYDATVVKDSKIPLICEKYGINEEWLRTGSGKKQKSHTIGDQLEKLAAESAHNNVEAVRKFFRELGDEFTDAEILFLYEIYKKHFGRAAQPAKFYPFEQKNTAAARSGDRAQAAEVSAQDEEEALSPPDSSDI